MNKRIALFPWNIHTLGCNIYLDIRYALMIALFLYFISSLLCYNGSLWHNRVSVIENIEFCYLADHIDWCWGNIDMIGYNLSLQIDNVLYTIILPPISRARCSPHTPGGDHTFLLWINVGNTITIDKIDFEKII